jgi:hypothetical protein
MQNTATGENNKGEEDENIAGKIEG